MKVIKRNNKIFTFSKGHKPAYTAKPGELVVFETSDCFNDILTSKEKLYSKELDDFPNPTTGPLYIENAQIGDILKVEVIDIKVNDKGVMTVDTRDPILGDRFERNGYKSIPIKDGYAIFNDEVRLPIRPMIGVIGVAPKGEEITTVAPGAHGGNMDCKEIVKGSTLYLNINADGGLLAMGDLHAIMGDGETGGCGLEINGEVTVKIDVIKDKILPTPIVVSGENFMIVATAKTMEDANKEAVSNMHHFLVNEVGIDNYDAAYLLSLTGDLKICQIVNPLMTVRMELPTSILEKYSYKLP